MKEEMSLGSFEAFWQQVCSYFISPRVHEVFHLLPLHSIRLKCNMPKKLDFLSLRFDILILIIDNDAFAALGLERLKISK